jgi:ribonuclease VapC
MFVADSSAILTHIFAEPGGEVIANDPDQFIVSSVNLAEIFSKLTAHGFSELEMQQAVDAVRFTVVDFDQSQAAECGMLWTIGRQFGLSLGDRACLALAKLRRLPVLTADRSWAKLDIGVDIKLIR